MRTTVRHYTGTAIIYVRSDTRGLIEIESIIHKLGGNVFRLANTALIFPYLNKTRIDIDGRRYIYHYSIDDHSHSSIDVTYSADNNFAEEVNIG